MFGVNLYLLSKGIAPTLIIVRVALGASTEQTAAGTNGNSTNLVWATNPSVEQGQTLTTETSTSRRGMGAENTGYNKPQGFKIHQEYSGNVV